MKKLITVTILVMLTSALGAQKPTTYKFVDRDSGPLYMDVYQPTGQSKNSCVIYLFGGGFTFGTRSDNAEFLQQLAQSGYTVAAIDYRLGLKGVTKVGPLNHKVAFQAVAMATEDLIAATDYIIKNSESLTIDTKRIAIVGSSAGAITALQGDYELSNRREMTSVLPADFRYAAVVSMAGAIFSKDGRPKYANAPAPTMLLHGTADRVVVYKKIQILKLGMFGTDALVKVFNKNCYPYIAIRYVDNKHDVATFPMHYNFKQICDFIDTSLDGNYTNQIDVTVKDRYAIDHFRKDLTRNEIYNRD